MSDTATHRYAHLYVPLAPPPPCAEVCWRWRDRERSAWTFIDGVHACGHARDDAEGWSS